MSESTAALEREIQAFQSEVKALRAEVAKAVVGQDAVVEAVLIGLFAGGHVLLEGVPGLGKTLLVKTLARALNVSFSRIQFTPDLMPADITGTNIVVEDERKKRYFEFQKGPVFANVILADEINRATPKTQSALLEAMQEATVTVSGVRHDLPNPFFVLATQNPIEMEGTYPLPEAQLDRFLFKVVVSFPGRADLLRVIDQTTGNLDPEIGAVMSGASILRFRELARQILMAQTVADYAVSLVLATHPNDPGAAPAAKRYVRFGASPRGAQAIVLAAKVRALMAGRLNISFDDVRAVIRPALRHRIILNFEGEAEGKSPDVVIDDVLQTVRA